MGLTRAMVEHGPGSPRYREVLIPSGDTHIVLSVWEADDTSAPVMVFVPGTMTHPLVYAECLDKLADRGTTVVGVHPVGHGNSPRTRRVIRLDDIVGNARDAVVWAAEHFDGNLVISGSSQGGIVALLAAVDAHPRVTACIAHNVLLPDLIVCRPELAEQVLAAVADLGFSMVLESIDPAIADAVAELLLLPP